MVEITFRNKKFEVKENSTARDALKKINIDPESVLISVNGKLVTDDIVLREGDIVKLVAVISGGGGDRRTQRKRTASRDVKR
jgi:sulfur carrier protein